jgi:hypothetical protein
MQNVGDVMSFPTIGFTPSYNPAAAPAFDVTSAGAQTATTPTASTPSTLPMYGDQYNARTNNALNSTDSKYANVTLAQNTHNALSNCFSVSPPAQSVCKHNKADDSGYWQALGLDESA